MSFARQGLVIAILAIVALGGWWAAEHFGLLQAAATRNGPGGGPGGGPDGRGPGAGLTGGVPVIAEPVRLQRDDVRIQAVGTGEALYGVTLYPAVAGEVVEIGFVTGQSVKKGDMLLRLDDEAERLAVEIAQLEARDAEVTLSRYRKAAPKGAVSAAEVDTARTALDRAKLRLEEAQVALRDRTLRAPFDGMIGTPEVDPGDRVTAATAIATLDARGTIVVTFDLPEIHAGKVRPGQELQVTPWSLPGRSFAGVVETLGSRIDPVSRTLKVRAHVANTEDLLRPGMSFAVALEIAGGERVSVPEIAVLWSRDGAFVWQVGPAPADPAGTARPAGAGAGASGPVAVRMPVKVHRRDGGRVLLDGGLQPGDLIVVEGVQRLREGSVLRPTTAGEGAAPAGAAPGAS